MVLSILGCATAAQTGSRSTVPTPEVHALFVDRPGVRLAVRVVGAPGAPVLIAIAGGPGYSHGYMEAFERLAVGPVPVRVVTYDPRGTGASRASAGATFMLRDTLEDLDDVRKAVGAERILVAGHSYGGLVAEAYASAYPQRTLALLLVDPMPDRRVDLTRAAELARRRADTLRPQGLYHEPPPPSGDDCRAAMNAELPLDFADPRHPAARELVDTGCSASIGGKTFEGLGNYDLSTSLAGLDIPVLLAFGEADPNLFELDELRHQLQGTSPAVATFPACGHYPFLECPDAFFERLRAFVATVE